MVAGRLRRRATFQEAVLIRDPDGMLIQGWEDRFTRWCHVHYLRGSETVMQARLVSKSPVILAVRASTETRAVTSEWRAVIAGGHLRSQGGSPTRRRWCRLRDARRGVKGAASTRTFQALEGAPDHAVLACCGARHRCVSDIRAGQSPCRKQQMPRPQRHARPGSRFTVSKSGRDSLLVDDGTGGPVCPATKWAQLCTVNDHPANI